MTWPEAKIQADKIMQALRSQFPPESVRLILRALSRQHHKDKNDKESESGRARPH